MSDEYSNVARGKLKLKTDEGGVSKKKSKKSKRDKDKLKAGVEHTTIHDDISRNQDGSSSSSTNTKRKLTKAEMAFKQMQEKTVRKRILVKFQLITFLFFQQKKRILEKASQTHKQRVEKFNQHLDSLTEHFDIPKVSWTK